MRQRPPWQLEEGTMTAVVVETAAGKLRGETSNGVAVFRGVRYGAPTERFRPPQAAPPWSGELDATEWGPAFPQPSMVLPPEVARVSVRADPQSEDALVLNVWTAAADSAKRPVMVWLHGGGFVSGAGSWPPYEGAGLAARDVVVVTVNHRLGLFGYLHLGELGGEEFAESGNVGMLDIVLALEWVRDNIAAFGGDPGNVTIFGESGGGAKVNALLAMPSAQGLFHRAVCQSGVMSVGVSPEDGTRTALAVLDRLGLERGDLKRLLEVPPDELIGVQSALSSSASDMFGGIRIAPVVGSASLPVAPFDAVAAGSARGIPLIVGTNKDEMTTFLARDPSFDAIDDEVLRSRLEGVLGADAATIEARYRETRPDASPGDLLVAILSDFAFRIPSIELAERQIAGGTSDVFMYLFAWETSAFGGRLKSNHALEIRFVFDNLAGSPDADVAGAQDLAASMSAAWAEFARHGDPNQPELPAWPRYTADERETMWLAGEPRAVLDPFAEERAVWSDLDATHRRLL
jgi:para-nitrobenzyl esterase